MARASQPAHERAARAWVQGGPSPPPPPQAPYFDSGRGAWVLSRYGDVADAFRHPDLWNNSQDPSKKRDARGVLLVRGEIQDALSPLRLAAWQSQMDDLAQSLLDELPRDRAVDLLHEFAMPLCLDLAMRITAADRAQEERLKALGAQVFAVVGEPDGAAVKDQADAATAELERMLSTGAIPQGEPAFVGVSQALPRLLASGWLALLWQPDELERLRGNPELMPSAIEELLRYAGIVPMVSRRARAAAAVAGVHVREGEKVDLMIASANRDPEQFPDPNRLDVGREPASQLSLGIGRNSCVGLVVIRMISAVTTAALLRTFTTMQLAEDVEWSVGSGFCCPRAVRVSVAT